MLQTNWQSNIPIIDPYHLWEKKRYRRRFTKPLISVLLTVMLVALTAFAASGPALAYNDGQMNPSGAAGAEATHPASALAGDEGQTQPGSSDFLDEVTVWSTTMTVREFPRAADFYGFSSHDSVGGLDVDTFVADGQTYTVNVVALSPFGNALGIRLSPDLDTSDTSQLILLVDGLDFSFADADIVLGYEENETLVVWEKTGLSWEDGQQVSLRLIEWEPGTCPVGEDFPADVQSAENPT